MAFRKVNPEELTSLWSEVYDPKLHIRIGNTTKDLPYDPQQMHVMIRKYESLFFSFAVRLSIAKDKGAANYTFTFTGALDKVRQGFRDYKHAFSEFGSEDDFVAYVKEGAELMFTSDGGVSRGARYVCQLV